MLLLLADVVGDFGGEVREGVDLPDGDGEQKCRNHRTENTFRTTELISHVDYFLI